MLNVLLYLRLIVLPRDFMQKLGANLSLVVFWNPNVNGLQREKPKIIY